MKKIFWLPALVTSVRHRCDAPFKFLFAIQQMRRSRLLSGLPRAKRRFAFDSDRILSSALLVLYFVLLQQKVFSQNPPSGGRGATYCNPINIDYGYTPIPNFSEWGRHRATADPVIVLYKNDYYLFSTNQWGYWWSNDMLNWKFISKKFLRPWNKVYDELCA